MKVHETRSRLRTLCSGRARAAIACALATLVLAPAVTQAKDAVPNLGGGLDQVASPSGRALAAAPAQRGAARSAAELEISQAIQLDAAGRALVRVSLDGKVPAAALFQSLRAMPGVEVLAADAN